MSTLALMRWLESSPSRYDAGMRALTLGRVDRLHDAIADAAAPSPGRRVLEIGCGTGTVTQRLVARGAEVVAIDQSAEMLAIARERVRRGVEWREQTAAEIDGLGQEEFDAVVLSLCLSEMSESERRFVLSEAARRLSPGGLLVAADEVHAPRGFWRVLQIVGRLPQAAAGWLVVGSVSGVVPDLASEVSAAGVEVVTEQRWLGGTLALVVGRRA